MLRKLLLPILFLALWIGCGPTRDTQRASFANSPSGDDRAELQALIDATPPGGTLTLPNGVFYVNRAGSAYYCLLVPANITIRGSGSTTIVQMAGIGASVRLFQMNYSGSVLERLILDGNAPNQTPDEHRAGVFIAAPGNIVRDVISRNFTGDGIYVYMNSDGALLENITAVSNRRNGVTLGGMINGITIRGGLYADNYAQQVDSEPGAPWTVNEVSIVDTVIDVGSSSNDFALTVSGTGALYRSHDWRVSGNTIRGAINVVWGDDILIGANTITNPTTKPSIRVYRTSSRVTIARNTIEMTRTTLPDGTELLYPSPVYVSGTGVGQSPDDILIAHNVISATARSAMGIRADGCLSVAIVDNVITGANSPYNLAAGIYLRATIAEQPYQLATIVNNVVTNFGQRGLSVSGNGTAKLNKLIAVGNTFGSADLVQKTGMVLDDGTHALVKSVLADNLYGTGVSSGRLGEATP